MCDYHYYLCHNYVYVCDICTVSMIRMCMLQVIITSVSMMCDYLYYLCDSYVYMCDCLNYLCDNYVCVTHGYNYVYMCDCLNCLCDNYVYV